MWGAKTATRLATRTATRTTRLGWRMAVATVLGALFGWWWDRPGLVKDKALESPFERRAQVSSAVFWPTFGLWLTAGAPGCPRWLIDLALWARLDVLPTAAWAVAVSLFATVVLMRRIMAATGNGWRLGAMRRASSRWLAHHPALTAALVAGAVVLPVWTVLTDQDPTPVGRAIPAVTVLAVGIAIAMREAAWRRRELLLRSRLTQVLAVTDMDLDDAVLMPRKGRRGFSMVVVPPKVIARLEGVKDRMATIWPQYEVHINRAEDTGDVTSLVFEPTGVEERSRREILDSTNGLVAALTPVDDPVPWRPDEHVAVWGDRVSGTMAAAVDAALEPHGYTVVEWDVGRREARVAQLEPDVKAARNRIAELLGTEPHTVEIGVERVHDDRIGRERLDQVRVHRWPSKGTDPQKRHETWRQLVQSLPDGSNGWGVEEDLVSGVVLLSFGQPRTLPDRVAMADMLPESLDPKDWSRLPLGVDPAGDWAHIDLRAGPHTLVVGPTGSGKSVFLRQHAMSALARGHQLIVIDPVKSGLDYLAFKPWCVAFGDDGIEQAQAMIERVYAEGMRRKALLREHEVPSWVDLPAYVRRRENVQPLTVLFDEFMSAVIPVTVPKGLDRDDPHVEEANRINTAKAITLSMVGKIARELRFVGVFLAVAMQRPDASQLPGFGEIRSNLTSAVQLVKPGALPAQETLRMVFPGEQTAASAETIMELDDGRSLGLAMIAADGGDVQGFRVAFGSPEEIPAVLETLGVERPAKWSVEVREPEVAGAPIVEEPRVQPWPAVRTPSPKVTDLGVVELSLDDLDALVNDEEPDGDTSDHGEFDFDEPRPVRTVTDDDEFGPLPTVPARIAASDDFDEFDIPTPPRPTVALDDLFD